MKHLLYSVIITLCVLLASCMQNDGNIGYLYGQWRLEHVDYNEIESECDTVFFSFQSNLFKIQRILYNSYDYAVFMGLYEHQNDYLKLNIYNHNGQDAVSQEQIQTMLNDLVSLHIDTVAPLFQVLELDNQYMTLQYNDYKYYFKKLN